MKQVSLEEYQAEIKAQGKDRIEDVEFICPRCETKQCAQDLINAGAGTSFDDVEKYLGFSCVGRFTKDKGCDWTLGGLFRIHKLEVITPDGEAHPRFEVAAKEAA